MSYEKILFELGVISHITLNSERNRNALGTALMQEIVDALEKVSQDENARVVLLDANGPDFCSGHDVTAFSFAREGRTYGIADCRKSIADSIWKNWYTKLWDYDKVIVAAVQGRAMTAGAEFALMADFVVASEDALFSWDVLRVWGGIPPSSLLPYLVGMRKATEIYLTGARINANEAQQLGLINTVVPREQLLPEAKRLAEAVAEMRPEVAEINKLVIRNVYNLMGFRNNMRFAHEMDAVIHSYPADIEKYLALRPMREKKQT